MTLDLSGLAARASHRIAFHCSHHFKRDPWMRWNSVNLETTRSRATPDFDLPNPFSTLQGRWGTSAEKRKQIWGKEYASPSSPPPNRAILSWTTPSQGFHPTRPFLSSDEYDEDEQSFHSHRLPIPTIKRIPSFRFVRFSSCPSEQTDADQIPVSHHLSWDADREEGLDKCLPQRAASVVSSSTDLTCLKLSYKLALHSLGTKEEPW